MLLNALEVSNIWTEIQTAITQLVTAVTAVFGFLTTSSVLPWVAVSVGIAVFGFAISCLKRILFGV